MASPKPTDYDRIAQKLSEEHSEDIFTYEDYSHYYDEYMQGANAGHIKNKEKVKQKSWDYYKTSKNLKPSQKERIKKIERERRVIKKRYVKKLVQQKPTKKRVRKFNTLGKVKGRRTYLRKIKTKTGVAYVDIKGRRGSIKKTKTKTTKRVRHRRVSRLPKRSNRAKKKNRRGVRK